VTPAEEADRWFRQAEADLKTADNLSGSEDYSACAFYSQQAAEKSLKALLYAKGSKIYGHSLMRLLEEVVNQNFPAPGEAIYDAAVELDNHYTTSRYPDAFENQTPSEYYTVEIAEEAIRCAKLILSYSGTNLRSMKNANGEESP
jgi:HEPN domain-containing protein